MIYSIGLSEFHRQRAAAEMAEGCASQLTVWWPYGLAFEFSAMLITHVFSSTNFTRQPQYQSVERYVKLLIIMVVVVYSKQTSTHIGLSLLPLVSSLKAIRIKKAMLSQR